MIVKDSIRRLYEAKKQYKEAEEYYNQVKKKENIIISNYIFSEFPDGQNSFEILMDEGKDFYTDKRKLRITRQRNSKIVWFVDELKKCLSKKLFKEITDCTYTVVDMDGLIEYLKTCGVKPEIFKKYIEVSRTVNSDVLNQKYEIGEISKKDVEGCYTVEYGEPFIKMTDLKKDRQNG